MINLDLKTVTCNLTLKSDLMDKLNDLIKLDNGNTDISQLDINSYVNYIVALYLKNN